MTRADSVRQACASLQAGGVIAYPTEAVWGLGCDPFNEKAVRRILDLKRRPVDKGLILVAADMQQLGELLAPLTDQQRQTLAESWPGPVTWLIPDEHALYPAWIRGQHASVAIRVSAHPVVQALCVAFGGPLVSTSANAAGEAEIKSRSRIEQQFGSSIDCIVDGELGAETRPSQIRDLESGSVLR